MFTNYESDGERRLGFYDGERLLCLSGPSTDRLVVEGFPDVPGEAPEERRPYRILPAMLRPGKIICLLRSYRAHAEEGGHEPPPDPMFFAKLRNALTGHLQPIVIPADVPGEVHHEGELAVVLGRGGANLDPAAARDCIAAYTIANDVTARTQQKADAGRGWPWLRAKSRDSFLPLGPGLVPASWVSDPQALDLTVRVNGAVRQRGSTSRLLWPLGEVLARISRYMTLEAGDVVLTGTPEGVGPIVPGDEVSVEISGLGRLANPVESERAVDEETH